MTSRRRGCLWVQRWAPPAESWPVLWDVAAAAELWRRAPRQKSRLERCCWAVGQPLRGGVVEVLRGGWWGSGRRSTSDRTPGNTGCLPSRFRIPLALKRSKISWKCCLFRVILVVSPISLNQIDRYPCCQSRRMKFYFLLPNYTFIRDRCVHLDDREA